jgi:hypothetical protein
LETARIWQAESDSNLALIGQDGFLTTGCGHEINLVTRPSAPAVIPSFYHSSLRGLSKTENALHSIR